MATTLSEYIVRKLIASSAVEEVDRELYIYGFFLLIARFFFFLATVAFGCFLRIPCESVVFYVVFTLLRSYAGGVHAKTETACTVLTTLALGISVAAIKMLEVSNREMIPPLIAGNVCIQLFSPLDSREKPLDAEERKRFRGICYGLLLVCDAVIFIFAVMKLQLFCCAVLYGICLEAILLSIGKICKHYG